MISDLIEQEKGYRNVENTSENESNNEEISSDIENQEDEEVASKNGSQEAEDTQESDNDTENDSEETGESNSHEIAWVAGVEGGRGYGKREKGREVGERGEGTPAIRTPFYSFLFCILACISVRDKHDEGIKKMCSTGISFGRSKLLQSCSNFTLKPELKPTVTACLAGRDAQEALYTGFVHYTERGFKAIAILSRHLQCRYSKVLLFRQNIYRLEWSFKWFAKRELKLW